MGSVFGTAGTAGSAPPNTGLVWLDPMNYGANGNGTTVDNVAMAAVNAAAGASTQVGVILRSPYLLNAITFTPNIQFLPVGNGKLIANAGQAVQVNSYIPPVPWQIFDISASGSSITGTFLCNGVFADWFGYSATDNYAMLFAALTQARLAGVPLMLLGKTYKFLTNLFGGGADAQRFYYPSIYGMGKQKTILDASGLSSGSALKFRGGSGKPISDTVLQGFQLLCNASVNGIENAGTIGFRMRDILYKNCASAQLFHNEDTGAFSEFNWMEDCEWDNNTVELEYKVTSGNDSFNNSGIKRGGIINCPTSASDHAVIKIGAGCKPYNTPVYTHIQGNGSTATLFRNGSTSLVHVEGTVTYEMSGGGTLYKADKVQGDFNAANAVRGTVVFNGTSASVENGNFVSAREILNDGSTVNVLGARRASTTVLASGSTTLTSLFGNTTRRVWLAVRKGAGFDWRTEFLVDGASPGQFLDPASGSIVWYDQTGTALSPALTVTVDGSGNVVVTSTALDATYAAYMEEQQVGGTRLHI